MFNSKFVVKCPAESLKIDSQIKKNITKNNFNGEFSKIKKKHGSEVTIFPEKFKSQNVLSKFLKPTSNVMKDLPEVKTSASSQ